jgi:hypothetical protein
MSNYGKIKSNVGTRIGDTSSVFASAIGTYVNQRYKDILNRTNWETLKEDYTISVVSGTSDYTLPTNFGKEMYAYDSTNSEDIPFASYSQLEELYQTELNSTGDVEFYTIFNTTDSTAASASRVKKFRLWKSPNSDFTVELPYTIKQAELSADTDELAVGCERAVEYGATSDAWMTKRQMDKAGYFEQLYEKEIQNLMWNEVNQPNQLVQMNVLPLSRDDGI